MTFLAKPFVALGCGAFFLCAATCAHFDEIATTPLSLRPDWAAGVLLVGGAVIGGREWSNGRTYEIAAWAFMVSLLFGTVLGNIVCAIMALRRAAHLPRWADSSQTLPMVKR